ncbi:lysosomal thioesterase PPT2 isoform X3 [Manis javanica]|uniref:lysosomal thioesterase PPT2 isoform X3 n=1 Tax=Manis javanica TaxID=9974 RepID=UPI00187A21DB|nr:lysosomal thioesterase PPT2 isoform X3 [Manis javanica]
MMMTTVRMVQSTIAAMPTAREMKEKFRASREAISADTMSPRAKAVRTCGGRVEEGRLELCCLASTPQPPLSAPPKAQDSQGVRKTSGSMLGPGPGLLPAGLLLLLPFLTLLLPAAPAPHRASYKPVIVVHGLFDSSYSFRHLLEYINETHPGTVVTVLDLFDGRESLRPLWEQVQGFGEAVAPIMAKAPQGVHLICYSQGGLVCRALLSVMDEHNVDSFISLSSPQMGQYGDTDYLKWLFPTSMRSNLYRICYSPWGQEFSICNYWHDPHHDDLYLNASSFLALINGERDHPNATAWRKNFLRVGRLVLIGGPDDGVITPWQSRKKNPVQDPAQEHALHLVIMSLQSLLIWNTFSVFVHYIDIFEEHGPAAL